MLFRSLENLVMLAGFPLTSTAIRELLGATIQVIVQLRRFPDGVRRIVAIDRVTGSDDQPLSATTLFAFEHGKHVAVNAARQEAGRE